MNISEMKKLISPQSIIKPYFMPLRSSFTKLSAIEVKEYVIVSIEKITPISDTVRPCADRISAKMGSLKVSARSDSDMHIAIVIIF